VHALAQKITETTESLKICYFVFILGRTSTNWNKQRMGRSESRSYWTCCLWVAPTSTACVRAGRRHFKHTL